jgi:hypothetical protein
VTHPDRTIFVTLGLDGTAGPLNDMANRLKHAGCKIDQTGTRWLDPTRFPDRDHIPAPPN